jgi:tetratricopeptide (TPR) repeat protein
MKSLLALPCLVILAFFPALGQTRGTGTRTVSPTRPRLSAPDTSSNSMIFLSGKAVIDDGSQLTESVSIQTICRGQKRTEAHTDSQGNFSFQFGNRVAAFSEGQFDADTAGTGSPGRPERRDLQSCELQAALPGFSSEVIQLGGRFTGDESADVGRIVLHRLSNVQGFTISATTAQAPGSAKKALQKGQEQQKRGKLEEAQKSFEKAVALYPKFAVAWFELGRVQLQKNDAAARRSFQQSIAADSKYVNPYLGLTQIAVRERLWKEVDETSDKLLAMNPVDFPDAWLYNAVANYYLENFADSEKSARRGLQIDTEHRVPSLEYTLAMTLLKKPDYQEAAQHFRIFLSHATKPKEVAEAQKQLQEIARLTGKATVETSQSK